MSGGCAGGADTYGEWPILLSRVIRAQRTSGIHTPARGAVQKSAVLVILRCRADLCYGTPGGGFVFIHQPRTRPRAGFFLGARMNRRPYIQARSFAHEIQLSTNRNSLSAAAESGEVGRDLGLLPRQRMSPRREVGPSHVTYVWPWPVPSGQSQPFSARR